MMREVVLVLSAVALGWALNNLWREERSRLEWDLTQSALKAQAEWEEFRKRQAQSDPEPSAAGVGVA